MNDVLFLKLNLQQYGHLISLHESYNWKGVESIETVTVMLNLTEIECCNTGPCPGIGSVFCLHVGAPKAHKCIVLKLLITTTTHLMQWQLSGASKLIYPVV